MENGKEDLIFPDDKATRPQKVLDWAKQISDEYKYCLATDQFDVKRRVHEDNYIKSPMGNGYNHIIAVVFHNVEINGKVTEFYLDDDGLHFNSYPFDLKTKDYGVQVHTVYRSEFEALAWVQTRAFHKGETYCYDRYIFGSEKPAPWNGEDWETIFHG